MNLLYWFFGKLHPEYSYKNRMPNFISSRLHRWSSKKVEQINKACMENMASENTFFTVAGAGIVSLSNIPNTVTGGAAGFSFSVSWSNYGICTGGVLGMNEAKRMAEFILEKCSLSDKTEDQILEEQQKYFDEDAKYYRSLSK